MIFILAELYNGWFLTYLNFLNSLIDLTYNRTYTVKDFYLSIRWFLDFVLDDF